MNLFEKQSEVITPDVITTELAIVAEFEKQEIVGSKAQMIQNAFVPMIETLKSFEAEYNEIISLNIEDPETAKKASDLRKKMVKVRTGTAAIHKEQKAEILREGRAIDGVKNILEWAVQDKEQNLSRIENYAANLEKEAKKKLFEERLALLVDVVSESEAKMIPLADLAPETFENMLNGYKLAKIERERVAKEEQEKAEKLKAEKEAEDLRVKQENEKLRVYGTRLECLLLIGFMPSFDDGGWYVHDGIKEAIQKGNIENYSEEDFKKYLEKVTKKVLDFDTKQKKIEQEKEAERRRQDLIALENQRKLNEKFKLERAERKRLEDEANAKAEKEEQERKERLAAERKLKRAPDRVKLLNLAEQIQLLPLPDLKEPESKEVLLAVQGLLAKTINYLKEKVEKL